MISNFAVCFVNFGSFLGGLGGSRGVSEGCRGHLGPKSVTCRFFDTFLCPLEVQLGAKLGPTWSSEKQVVSQHPFQKRPWKVLGRVYEGIQKRF